jgi:KDO2-lipid IV(A) lauroyltransferase
MGMGVMEMAAAWWATDRKLAGLGRIEGLEHLQNALDRGRGALLVSGHFSAFEIAGRLLLRQQAACFTYREFRNPVLHDVMERARRRRCTGMIHRYDVRGFIRALRANQVVWYAPDQDPGRRRGVFVPFFGVTAASLPATSRLAAATGAAVLPLGMRRLPDGSGYRLTICPALRDFPSGDTLTDTQRLTELLEKEIRAVPEQYLWIHRRFKTRPEGKASYYPPNLRRLRRRLKGKGA